MLDTHMEPINPVSAREQLEALFRDASTDVFTPVRQYDDQALIKVLEKDSKRVSDTDADGNTALMVAVKLNPVNYSAIDYLLKAGANPNVPDGDGKTALTVCSIKVDLKAIDRLLKAGARPLAVDNSGKRPIDYLHFGPKSKGGQATIAAIAMMAESIAKAENNPEVEVLKLRPMHWAALSDDDLMMNRLLEMGAMPFAVAKNGKTVFECAKGKKKVWNVMLRELAIQFRQEFERMRDKGRLTTSELIKFFEQKGMRSPEGFTLWTLSEVRPVLDYLKRPAQDETLRPAMGVRKSAKLEKLAKFSVAPPVTGASLTERIAREAELQSAIDAAVLLMAGAPPDAVAIAMEGRRISNKAFKSFSESDVIELLHKYGLYGFRAKNFVQAGGTPIIETIADSMLDFGALLSDIEDEMIRSGLVPSSDRALLSKCLTDRFGP